MSSSKKAAPKTPSRKSAVAAPRSGRTRQGRGRSVRQDQRKVLKVGLHFGDTKTTVAASENGDPIRLKRDVFTNIVGFVRLHAPLTRLLGKSDVLYAEQATKFLQQVDLQKPILSGLVNDVRVCRQFITHVCSAIDPSGSGRIWGVASIPAVAGPVELEKAYRSLKGPLERVVVVPEPYLVAEGMRLEKAVQFERLKQDLTRGSLVIDIGTETTNICLVRGSFPTPEDQIRLEIAGNSIDDRIFTNALVRTPTLLLSRRMAREIKEEQAFVGGSPADEAREGSDLLAFTDVIRKACEKLLEAILDASCNLLGRYSPDVAAALSRSIVLTGGGSQIRNLPVSLEHNLRARGYQDARVHVPEDHKTLVARGALRFAQTFSDEEWESLASKTPAEIARLFSGSPDAAGAPSQAGEVDSMATVDVGLRSEASPWAESDRPADPLADPQTPAHRTFLTSRQPRKEKEKEAEESTAVNLEELDFFKTL